VDVSKGGVVVDVESAGSGATYGREPIPAGLMPGSANPIDDALRSFRPMGAEVRIIAMPITAVLSLRSHCRCNMVSLLENLVYPSQ
jgi:hypothetical protein